MIPLRAAIGPVVIGTAVWCAAGTLTTADAMSPAARLAVPAPWWVLLLAIGGAMLVRPLRQTPRTALPALLTTLPWWPVPVPAAVLLWTGPLAWLPIACTLAAAYGGRIASVVRRAADTPTAMLGRRLAALLTLVACGGALWSAGYRLRGDEPHYLMITESLLDDGDLRIENNHDRRAYAAFYRDGRLDPDFTVRGANGAIYSIHAPGTAALVLPAYALAGWRGAQLLLLLLSAITGALIWEIGHRVTGDARAAWFAWAATVLTPTYLLHAFAVFPDAPAALVTAATIVLVLRLRAGASVGPGAIVSVSALLALLPWLHSRLVVLACGLGLVTLWHLWRDTSEPAARRVRRLALFGGVPVLGALAWFSFFWVIYGAPDPRLPYGGDDAARVTWIPAAILGLLFDQQFGLFLHAPVLAAAAIGFLKPRDMPMRAALVQVLLATLVYLAAVTLFRMWWAGIPSAPARFLMALIPALAAPAAIAWHHACAATRSMLAGLLSVSVATSALLITVDRGALAWNQRDAQARFVEWLAPVVNLPRALPSFFWAGDAAFVLHVCLTVGIVSAAWISLRRLGARRHFEADTWRLATSLWIPLGLMLAAPVGWALTGSNGLDPTRSQIALATRAADGQAPLAIAPFSVSARPDLARRLIIRTEQLDRWRDQVRVQTFADLPAGRYRLRRRGARSTDPVTATVGDSPAPVETLDAAALDAGAAVITLAGGARRLHFGSPDEAIDMTAWAFELVPEILWAGQPASRTSRFGDATMFSSDGVFIEPGGFWVEGVSTASVQFTTALGELLVTIGNGPVENTVTVRSGAAVWSIPLGPDEARPLSLPATDGVVRVTITSARGFAPSQFSDSGDTRHLGVWVGVR